MKKSSKLYSILAGTCPVCHEGKMYEYGPYKLSKMTKIRKHCPHCNAKLEPEPSFYTGAMYVSYAFSVAIVVGVFVAYNVLFENPQARDMIRTGIILAILFAPLNLRLSRNIWANVLIKYRPEKSGKDKNN